MPRPTEQPTLPASRITATAQAERAAARAELNQRPSLDLLGADDVTKMIDELGDVSQVLDQAEPQNRRTYTKD